jgi:hypothetical protein
MGLRGENDRETSGPRGVESVNQPRGRPQPRNGVDQSPQSPSREVIARLCNRCNSRTDGVCLVCGCPEYRLVSDPQLRLF